MLQADPSSEHGPDTSERTDLREPRGAVASMTIDTSMLCDSGRSSICELLGGIDISLLGFPSHAGRLRLRRPRNYAADLLLAQAPRCLAAYMKGLSHN